MAEDIAEALAMLLPPGILFDSPEIYAEVAKLPVVPLENIRQHWQSYTSMYKKLQDPTACRLENFWWHVWGSDRSQLSGQTIARLWQEIASGPTFVPLRQPPRRPEHPPLPHTRSMHESDRQNQAHKGGPYGAEDEAGTSLAKNLTPSSSRPPPTHPILKKPRGPSNSGPRPTARFVDVPESEDDIEDQSSGSQQSGAAVSRFENVTRDKTSGRSSPRSKSPATTDRKSASSKRFVASTAGSKRRPVLPRRQSSQSSTGSAGSAGSDNSSKEGNHTARKQTTPQGSIVSSQDNVFLNRQEDLGLASQAEEGPISGKALGKRPANKHVPAKIPPVVRSSPRPGTRGGYPAAPKRTSSPLSQGQNMEEDDQKESGGLNEQRLSAKALGKQPASLSKLGVPPPSRGSNVYDSTSQRAEKKTAASPDTRATESNKNAESEEAGGEHGNSMAAPVMAHSRSNAESKRMTSSSMPNANFKSPSVVGMSKLAVSGGFDFETPQARPSEGDLPPLAADQLDMHKPSILDSKLTPTQPSPNPELPLGRSKSQLTLLLERDKARIGDKHRIGSSSNVQKHEGKDHGRK